MDSKEFKRNLATALSIIGGAGFLVGGIYQLYEQNMDAAPFFVGGIACIATGVYTSIPPKKEIVTYIDERVDEVTKGSL